MISPQRVDEINAAIVKLQGDLQEGKKVYKEILHNGEAKNELQKPPIKLLVAGSPHYMTSYVKITSW